MVYKEVKKALLDQGLKQKDLAERTGFSLMHLNAVINGRAESRRVKKIIALILGRPFEELWGGHPEAK